VRVILGRDFLKSAALLPNGIKKKLATSIGMLEKNPYSPILHTKKLTGELTGLFSFRITRDWRVIFYFKNPETICIVDVGNRKDIYR